jgi:hypothetical protein
MPLWISHIFNCISNSFSPCSPVVRVTRSLPRCSINSLPSMLPINRRVAAGNQALGCLREQSRMMSIRAREQLNLRSTCFPNLEEGPPGLTGLDAVQAFFPKIMRPTKTPSAQQPRAMTFFCKKALAHGWRRLSQVYRGSLKASGLGTPDNINNPKLDDVVLKIYDGSRFPTAQQVYCSGDYGTAYPEIACPSKVFVPAHLAWQEAWVYHKLKPSHHLAVPQFLGAYEVRYFRLCQFLSWCSGREGY